MPSYILKLRDEKHGRDYYLEWSTIVDAPVTDGMTREEFMEYYKNRYGTAAMEREFGERMARVDATGTSSRIDSSAADVWKHNRAGQEETSLDLEGILDRYCRAPAQT